MNLMLIMRRLRRDCCLILDDVENIRGSFADAQILDYPLSAREPAVHRSTSATNRIGVELN